MHRTKRPLAEIDPNASTRSFKSAKTHTNPTATTIRRPGSRYVKDDNVDQEVAKPVEQIGEKIDYTKKDNSKLRYFLSERDLPTSGTREELINRLQNSSIDYEDLTSTELSDMMKGRCIVNVAVGGKETKIKRLRINDLLDSHTGEGGNSPRYGVVRICDLIREEAQQKSMNPDFYNSFTASQLTSTLRNRKIDTKGSREQQELRLCKADKEDLKNFRKRYEDTKRELELYVGHEVDVYAYDKKYDELLEEDRKLQAEAPRSKGLVPTCTFQMKDSRWALRSGRELSDICHRRGLEDWGTKATYVKWLETGRLEYEDICAGSLETKCRKRGIQNKSSDKKVDLIRRLREVDGDEGDDIISHKGR